MGYLSCLHSTVQRERLRLQFLALKNLVLFQTLRLVLLPQEAKGEDSDQDSLV